MSNDVFPSQIFGLTPQVIRTPEFDTLVQSSASGVRLPIAQMQNPLWHWALVYEQLFNNPAANSAYTISELQTLMGFFLDHQGQFDDFLFDDPEDDTVTNQVLQLVNDGAGSYYSPVQRQMGNFLEDVTDLNGAISVKANGVAQAGGGTNYTLLGPGLAIPGYSFEGLYLKWVAAPTGPITASFQFYFRVAFEADKQDFEKFLYQLWTIGGAEGQRGSGLLKLVTSRTTA
jgi:hypothetical protein